jgi:flagellar assembly factor FliW
MLDPFSLAGSEVLLDPGLPGFPTAHRFLLTPWGSPAGPFWLMLCRDTDGLAFIVIPPRAFFPDYEPEINRATVERLGIATASDAAVYVIVTPGLTSGDATANLLGPIVINRHSLLATQMALDPNHWGARTPLVAGPAWVGQGS